MTMTDPRNSSEIEPASRAAPGSTDPGPDPDVEAQPSSKKPTRNQRLLDWVQEPTPTGQDLRRRELIKGNTFKCSLEVLAELAQRIDDLDDAAFALLADPENKVLGKATDPGVGVGLALSSRQSDRQKRLIMAWAKLPPTEGDHTDFVADRLQQALDRSDADCPLTGLTDLMFEKVVAALHGAIHKSSAPPADIWDRLVETWSAPLAQQEKNDQADPTAQARWLEQYPPKTDATASPEAAARVASKSKPKPAGLAQAGGASIASPPASATAKTKAKALAPPAASPAGEPDGAGLLLKVAALLTKVKPAYDRQLEALREQMKQAEQRLTDQQEQKRAVESELSAAQLQLQEAQRTVEDLKARAGAQLVKLEALQEVHDALELRHQQTEAEVREQRDRLDHAQAEMKAGAADTDRRLRAREVDVRRQLLKSMRERLDKLMQRAGDAAEAIPPNASGETRKLQIEVRNLVESYRTLTQQVASAAEQTANTGADS